MGGTAYQTLADIEAGRDEAELLAATVTNWLVSAEILRPQLAEGHLPGARWADATLSPDYEPAVTSVITTRTVFHPGTYMGDQISCPACARQLVQEEMDDTIDDWYSGGDGIRVCAGCRRPNGINEWVRDPAWAFGHLGFEFASWPPLHPAFVTEMADRLGHRVVLVDGYW